MRNFSGLGPKLCCPHQTPSVPTDSTPQGRAFLSTQPHKKIENCEPSEHRSAGQVHCQSTHRDKFRGLCRPAHIQVRQKHQKWTDAVRKSVTQIRTDTSPQLLLVNTWLFFHTGKSRIGPGVSHYCGNNVQSTPRHESE